MNVIMRHSIDNNKKIGGWSKCRLTKKGKMLASSTAKALEKCGFNKIICSDLVRAKQTAKIISKQLRIPYFETKELRELNVGTLSGKKIKHVLNKLNFLQNNLDEKEPIFKGESIVEFRTRVLKFYNEQIKTAENTLFITHKNFICAAIAIINKNKYDYLSSKKTTINHCDCYLLSENKIKKLIGVINEK